MHGTRQYQIFVGNYYQSNNLLVVRKQHKKRAYWIISDEKRSFSFFLSCKLRQL